MIVIVSLVFAGSLVTVCKLDLGHTAIVYSLSPFSSLAAPSAHSAIEIVRMFSLLDFRRLSQIQTLITTTENPPALNLERVKGRKVIDRETEREREREREREKGRMQGNCAFVLLFTDIVY